MFRFGILGSGRIGAMHAELIAQQPGAQVSWCYDTDPQRAHSVADRVGAKPAESVDQVLDSNIDAVLIAAPTNQHVDLILRAAAAGKAILCEKPIDVDMARVEECRRQLAGSKVAIQLGFNRRFDPSHAAVREAVKGGEIGALEMLVITSRDPGPPPPRVILEACGGLFRDTTIHDFDMARFVLGEEPVEVYATASNLVDPVFGELNDFDTAMVIIRTASGALCHINNSRRTNYGYDQRVEAFGAGGMVRSNNHRGSEISRSSAQGTELREPLLNFFIERYREAYSAQIRDFVDCVRSGRAPSVSFEDGRRALVLAEAAIRSHKENRPVTVEY